MYNHVHALRNFSPLVDIYSAYSNPSSLIQWDLWKACINESCYKDTGWEQKQKEKPTSQRTCWRSSVFDSWIWRQTNFEMPLSHPGEVPMSAGIFCSNALLVLYLSLYPPYFQAISFAHWFHLWVISKHRITPVPIQSWSFQTFTQGMLLFR